MTKTQTRLVGCAWTSHETDTKPFLHKSGETLCFCNKILDRFVGVERMLKQHRNVAVFQADADTIGESMCQLGHQHCQSIHENFSMDDIMPAMELKLPFPCKPEFHDPCQPEDKGCCLKSHPHEKDASRRFLVMHVNLVDAAMPRTKVAPDHEEVNWQAVAVAAQGLGNIREH